MKERKAMTRLGALLAAIFSATAAAVVRAQGPAPKTSQAVGSLQTDALGGAVVPIYGFGFTITNTTTSGGGGGGAGQATLSDVDVSRLSDALSTSLFRAGVTRQHSSSVRITVFASGKLVPEAVHVLNDALVLKVADSDGVEDVSFGYRSIEAVVGGSRFCFDTATSTSC
jgi:hypothetical protein